jgi:glycosyltransferase involved in cell wall biosynthesis
VKTVCLAVTSDPQTDQRVLRVASSLTKHGIHVVIIGRTNTTVNRKYEDIRLVRFRMFFHTGFLFYAEYNIRLLFFLLIKKADLIVANDLDTLPACWFVSRIKRTSLLYDAHEFFTDQAGLKNRRFVRGFWKWLEGWMLPGAASMSAVNESIAGLYEDEYGIKPVVIRNLARYRQRNHHPESPFLPDIADKKVVILQGTGINLDRGGEEAVLAMKYVEGVLLVIAGNGLVIPELKRLVASENLEEKVMFIQTLDYEDLMELTAVAELGLSLDKPMSLNQMYSLPNKLFDYIQARVPVLTSDLPEIRRIVDKYQVGLVCKEVTPEVISRCIREALYEKKLKFTLRENLDVAAGELCWEKEESRLIELYAKVESIKENFR